MGTTIAETEMSRNPSIIDPADSALRGFLALTRVLVLPSNEPIDVSERRSPSRLRRHRAIYAIYAIWTAAVLGSMWTVGQIQILPVWCIVETGWWEPPDPPREITEEQAAEIAHRIIDTGRFTPPPREGLQTDYRRIGEFTEFQAENGITDEVAEAAVKWWLMNYEESLDWPRPLIESVCLRFRDEGIDLDDRPVRRSKLPVLEEEE